MVHGKWVNEHTTVSAAFLRVLWMIIPRVHHGQLFTQIDMFIHHDNTHGISYPCEFSLPLRSIKKNLMSKLKKNCQKMTTSLWEHFAQEMVTKIIEQFMLSKRQGIELLLVHVYMSVTGIQYCQCMSVAAGIIQVLSLF